jgi:hypothetical protein
MLMFVAYWFVRTCARDDCDETFQPTSRTRRKRYCTERCQRIAERRRYRERHTEQATCARPACSTTFERETTNAKKPKIYCTLECQYADRSETFRERPSILTNIARARQYRRGGPQISNPYTLRDAHTGDLETVAS